MSESTTALTATAQVLNNLVSESSSIIKQFLESAMASPLMAAAAVIITVDILELQFKILSHGAAILIEGMVVAALAIDASTAILSDITGIFHFGASSGTTTSAFDSGLKAFTKGAEEKSRQVQTQPIKSLPEA